MPDANALSGALAARQRQPSWRAAGSFRGMPAEQDSALRAAIQSCDWKVLKKRMAVSCKYLEDAYARPSGRATFESIALRAPTVGMFVFQGNHDSQTPVRYARELEAWNNQRGHLHLTFRYYDGAHVGGPPQVERELSDLLVRLTAPDHAVRGASPDRTLQPETALRVVPITDSAETSR